jgi:hypothetical protein
MPAGDDVGDDLDNLGQRPLQGNGEAVAFGERSGGDAHQQDRGHEALGGPRPASQRFRVEVMRPCGRCGRTWPDLPDREQTRLALRRRVDQHDQRRPTDVYGELRVIAGGLLATSSLRTEPRRPRTRDCLTPGDSRFRMSPLVQLLPGPQNWPLTSGNAGIFASRRQSYWRYLVRDEVLKAFHLRSRNNTFEQPL